MTRIPSQFQSGDGNRSHEGQQERDQEAYDWQQEREEAEERRRQKQEDQHAKE